MDSLPVSFFIRIFVGALVFGTLLNLGSVKLLRDFWSTYDLGGRIPSFAEGRFARLLIGLPVIRYVESRTVYFPWFELCFASLTLLALLLQGPGWEFVRTIGFLVFAMPLAVVSMLDNHGNYTPDSLTISGTAVGLITSWLPGAMTPVRLGLFANANGSIDLFSLVGPGVVSCAIGAAAGYLILFSVARLFNWFTNNDGMGEGCFKALMMIGAFGGWQVLPAAILLSSASGALVGIFFIVRGRDRNVPMPFTPYLMVAGIIVITFGDQLTEWYLHSLGGSDGPRP